MRLVVSGGATGIGAAVVAGAAARGWSARGAGRREGLDVRDEATIARWLGDAPVDAAVCAAGVSPAALLLHARPEVVADVVETNVLGALAFARAAVARGARRVVLLGSLHQLGAPANAAYASSKAALVGLLRALDAGWPEVATHLVVPGFVPTALAADLPPAVAADLRARSPLGRALGADEVADVILTVLAGPGRGRIVRATGGLVEVPA